MPTAEVGHRPSEPPWRFIAGHAAGEEKANLPVGGQEQRLGPTERGGLGLFPPFPFHDIIAGQKTSYGAEKERGVGRKRGLLSVRS